MVNNSFDAEKVRRYYDDFLHSTMLDYRLHGNKRISRAADRILSYVEPDSRVVDLGCGIGIVAERIARKSRRGMVWAFDISEENIWYAKQTIKSDRIYFFVGDVIHDFASIKGHVPTSADVVTLVDVLEHLPQNSHHELFQNLRSITREGGLLILTYPSPEYQRYLQSNEPDQLQLIDEVVELEDLIKTAAAAGYSLKEFALEDVWMSNQYAHAVFVCGGARVETHQRHRGTILGRIARKLAAPIDRKLLLPLRKRKYVLRVFGEEGGRLITHKR